MTLVPPCTLGKNNCDREWGVGEAFDYQVLFLNSFARGGINTTSAMKRRAKDRANTILDTAYCKKPHFRLNFAITDPAKPAKPAKPGNRIVPLKPHPTIPNRFVVKQETKWALFHATGGNFTRSTKLILQPDGYGSIVLTSQNAGILPSEIFLPNPEWRNRSVGSEDVIKYRIIVKANKQEFILFNKTGSHTALIVNNETIASGTVLQEFQTVPGPQRRSLLFNNRRNVNLKYTKKNPNEVLVKQK